MKFALKYIYVGRYTLCVLCARTKIQKHFILTVFKMLNPKRYRFLHVSLQIWIPESIYHIVDISHYTKIMILKIEQKVYRKVIVLYKKWVFRLYYQNNCKLVKSKNWFELVFPSFINSIHYFIENNKDINKNKFSLLFYIVLLYNFVQFSKS